MKKALFNDLYGLTDAVIERRKKQTRRICKNQINPTIEDARWRIGEIIAVAQNYITVMENISKTESVERAEYYCKIMRNCYPNEEMSLEYESIAGCNNKMFVRADLMPHQIKITNIRIEKLQDISDEDCFGEGIVHTFDCGFDGSGSGCDVYHLKGFHYILCDSARGAFETLIDKINGKGTWESNPYVFVYEFDLIK